MIRKRLTGIVKRSLQIVKMSIQMLKLKGGKTALPVVILAGVTQLVESLPSNHLSKMAFPRFKKEKRIQVVSIISLRLGGLTFCL